MKPSRRITILIAGAVLALFSMACGLGAVMTPANQAAAASTPAASNAPDQLTATMPAAVLSAPSLSADEVYTAVAAAMAKLDTAGPRHVSQTSYKGDAAATDLEMDAVPPNYHQVISLKGKKMAEQYVVDNNMYTQVAGQWQKVEGGGTTFKETLKGFGESLAGQIVRSDGKVEGIEMVNGKPAILYSYTTMIKDLSKNPTLQKLWVDPVSGLPVKQETDIPDAKDATITDKIVQLITYDPKITITLPDEAKNAKSAK
jgi:outer membrane lipoprotein-sorting protein